MKNSEQVKLKIATLSSDIEMLFEGIENRQLALHIYGLLEMVKTQAEQIEFLQSQMQVMTGALEKVGVLVREINKCIAMDQAGTKKVDIAIVQRIPRG